MVLFELYIISYIGGIFISVLLQDIATSQYL